MRYSNNIFEPESHRGSGGGTLSDTGVVTIVLSVISLLSAIFVIANFGEITASIAIWVVNTLSAGVPFFMIGAVILYFVLRLKHRWHRRF